MLMDALARHWGRVAPRLQGLLTRDRWLALAALVVMWSLVGVAMMCVLAVAHKPSWLSWDDAVFMVQLAVQGACYSVVGLLLVASRPRQFVGWLVIVTGLYFSAGPTLRLALADQRPTGVVLTLLAWLIPILYYLPGTLDNWLLLWLPDGRLPSRRWRFLVAVSFVALALEGLIQAGASPVLFHVHGVASPLVSSWWAPIAGRLAAQWDWVRYVIDNLGWAVIVVLLLRWRHMSDVQRRQLAVALPAYTLWRVVALAWNFDMAQGWLFGVVTVTSSFLWPAALGYALTQSRSPHLDRAARRVIVGTVVTITLVAAYLGAVVAFSSLRITGVEISVVLAASVGLGVLPLVTWTNRRVEGVFYGERARPYEVVRALAGRLRDGMSPAEVPETVCRTVVHTLRLPAAALVAQTRNGPRRLSMVGSTEISDLNEVFELCYRGTAVGLLWVRARQGQRELDELDRTVLQSLADQAAPAVAGLRLLEDLQASRERLVVAREEERLRLRRDLHDGIGPTLAGIRLQLDTARAALPVDSPASGLLRQVGSEIGAVVAELRLVTDSLRPPALDQLGLAGAVRELVNRLSSPALPIHVSLPPDLSGLPAAVEVAVYRILAEALANVISHAGAGNAYVQIAVDENTVDLDVVDDGAGLPSKPRPEGIGLTSMRERTQEIGGQYVIATVPEGGTRVHAILPRILAKTVPPLPETGSPMKPQEEL
ncbi:MAG: sensor histidine kinase [Pseudonocardiaceae bacterium]